MFYLILIFCIYSDHVSLISHILSFDLELYTYLYRCLCEHMYMNIHIHKHVLIKKILAQSIWEIVNTGDNQTRSLEDESPVM